MASLIVPPLLTFIASCATTGGSGWTRVPNMREAKCFSEKIAMSHVVFPQRLVDLRVGNSSVLFQRMLIDEEK